MERPQYNLEAIEEANPTEINSNANSPLDAILKTLARAKAGAWIILNGNAFTHFEVRVHERMKELAARSVNVELLIEELKEISQLYRLEKESSYRSWSGPVDLKDDIDREYAELFEHTEEEVAEAKEVAQVTNAYGVFHNIIGHVLDTEDAGLFHGIQSQFEQRFRAELATLIDSFDLEGLNQMYEDWDNYQLLLDEYGEAPATLAPDEEVTTAPEITVEAPVEQPASIEAPVETPAEPVEEPVVEPPVGIEEPAEEASAEEELPTEAPEADDRPEQTEDPLSTKVEELKVRANALLTQLQQGEIDPQIDNEVEALSALIQEIDAAMTESTSPEIRAQLSEVVATIISANSLLNELKQPESTAEEPSAAAEEPAEETPADPVEEAPEEQPAPVETAQPVEDVIEVIEPIQIPEPLPAEEQGGYRVGEKDLSGVWPPAPTPEPAAEAESNNTGIPAIFRTGPNMDLKPSDLIKKRRGLFSCLINTLKDTGVIAGRGPKQLAESLSALVSIDTRRIYALQFVGNADDLRSSELRALVKEFGCLGAVGEIIVQMQSVVRD